MAHFATGMLDCIFRSKEYAGVVEPRKPTVVWLLSLVKDLREAFLVSLGVWGRNEGEFKKKCSLQEEENTGGGNLTWLENGTRNGGYLEYIRG